MKTSVVISTYNGERYIIEELESLLHQSRLPDEVLLFDDQSTDNTVSLVKNFIEENALSNWSIQVNAVNKGWKRNFMEGIKEATGDIVFIADQDDIWVEDKVSIMSDIIERTSSVNVLVSNYTAFYDNGKTYVGPGKNDDSLEPKKFGSDLFNTMYPGCTYCVRKEFFDLCFKYWEEDFPHDAFLWKNAVQSNSAFSINKSLVRWRKHEDSAFATSSRETKNLKDKTKWIDYALRSIEALKAYSADNNLTNNLELIKRTSEWCRRRLKFYKSKKFFDWFTLVRYIDCYSRKKQFIGELYLVYFSRHTKK
ncbi:MAG: glycosyltransferase [Lachnospiraceae bacterium]|nr:glycosyltransferase [Lachnospiraceae bacterium]